MSSTVTFTTPGGSSGSIHLPELGSILAHWNSTQAALNDQCRMLRASLDQEIQHIVATTAQVDAEHAQGWAKVRELQARSSALQARDQELIRNWQAMAARRQQLDVKIQALEVRIRECSQRAQSVESQHRGVDAEIQRIACMMRSLQTEKEGGAS